MNASELGILFAIALGAVVVIGRAFTRLKPGILALELAWDPEKARRIVDEWRRRGVAGAAKVDVWIDFAWIVAYTAALVLFALLARKVADDDDTAFVFLAAGALAGVLDFIENFGLLSILKARAKTKDKTVYLTSAVATGKWFLVLVSIIGSAAIMVL